MSVVFNKKAIILYGCAQLADGSSVINNAPSGTISTVAGSPTVTGVGTQFLSEVAPHSYMFAPNGDIVGQVKTVSSNTSLILYTLVPITPTAASPGVMGISADLTASAFKLGLGPNNALAALDATFSTNYETEEYVFVGDELDRSLITSVKDFYGNLDFSILMPTLGTVTSTRIAGAGTLRATVGSPNVIFTNAVNVAVNDFLYTTAGVLIGRIQSIVGLNAVLTGTAGINAINVAFRIGKNASTPVYEDLPFPDWFQTAGFGLVLSTGRATYTNEVSSNTKMTIEVRLSSPDLASKRQQKAYTLTDVRGTIDLDTMIGSYGKVPFKFMGNLPIAPAQKTEIIANYGTKKMEIAETISDLSITLAALGTYTSRLLVAFSATSLSAAQTVNIGGLVYTSTGVTTQAQLVELFEGLELNVLGSSLPVPATGTWSGQLVGYYSVPYSVTGVLFLSPSAAGSISTIAVDGGTGPVPTVTMLSSNAQAPTPSESNICFKQINAPNLTGYTFTRFNRSCGRGWDKQADPSDVTVSILEDAANAAYVPELNLAKHHSLYLFYGSDVQNRRVSVTFNDLILQKITNNTQDNSRGQDLAFRNSGTTDLVFQ